MQAAQEHTLNLSNWHHFLSALTLAGYRSGKMISSETAIIYCYVLYLIGIIDYGIDKQAMRQAIAEFFFMAALTGRYTSSSETRFESDLGLVRDLGGGKAFLNRLREIAATALTKDYWEITLPTQLATSAARSPSLFAYQAALIKLDARILYSKLKISSMVDPSVKGSKAAIEQHHLFPRGYLERIGIRNRKLTNQIANFAPVEWPDNNRIGKTSPADYAPSIEEALLPAERKQMYDWHALPLQWWSMEYEEFLIQRRVLMAKVIHDAWNELTGAKKPVEITTDLTALLAHGESEGLEFKSTLRTNLHTNQPDERMQHSVLKTIAGFFNAHGGTLVIGVNDHGEAIGLDADKFENEDKMSQHLVNLVRDRIGDLFLPYMHAHFDDKDGQVKDFLSITLDDPTFPTPLNIAAFLQGDGKWTVTWRRRQAAA